MDEERQTRIIVLCSLLLCLLHANKIIGMDTLLSCGSSCLRSISCGWIVHNEDSHECFTKESVDCDLLARSSLKIYRRLYSGESVKSSNRRDSTFELLDPKHMTCPSNMTSCYILAPLPNAYVEYDSLFPGSKAKYVCKDGFSFCGPNVKEVTCMINGSWTAPDNGCSQDRFRENVQDLTNMPCPLTVGSTIVVSGVPRDSFDVMLFDKADPFTEAMFAVNVSFPHKSSEARASLIHLMNERFRSQFADTCPFTLLKEFNLTIAVREKEFELYVDGKWFAVFTHRSPFQDFTLIRFLGNIRLNHVTFVH